MQLVLLMLAVMWVAAGIYWYRGRPEGRPVDSIGTFRRQLRVLERTAPSIIDPAHRMRDRLVGAAMAPELLERPFGPSGLSRTLASTPGLAAHRRRQMLKRRRDVFFGLLLGIAGSALMGIFPPLRAMWALSAVLIVAFAAYVLVLVQLRNREAERSMKVRFLPRPGVAEPALLLRRSAN